MNEGDNQQSIYEAITTDRHVIFLGAGASVSSGYPTGYDLRLRICSEKQFMHDLQAATGFGYTPANHYWQRLWQRFGLSINAFREGNFATVDEFSKLASNENRSMVQEMKVLIRFALAFHNPELEFQKSDYDSLISRLFNNDVLHSLKSNITILSYNYDFYLDYLLDRAQSRRRGVAGINLMPEPQSGFQLLKLHGSIRQDPTLYGRAFFRDEAKARLDFLMDDAHMIFPPPIVFPWELFDDSGNFINEDDFIFVKTLPASRSSTDARQLFQAYKKTWEDAKAAVRKADKISFVGLSAHGYMDAGLKYLFDGKAGGVEMVVANIENKQFPNSRSRLHPASLCGKLHARLKNLAPHLKYIKSSSEDDGMFTEEGVNSSYIPDITPRSDFKEFIQTEID